MRINKLEFSAVGPYAGHEVIDFDALGTSALYLIDGPTGAGKSTIIDCIVYALYNDMSGEASDDARIRSQFADASTPTYVELTFTSSQGTFRIRRSPEYMRTRLRGEGLTKESASATVHRVTKDGQLETVATQVRESSMRLGEQLIGLKKPQFTQTVILPQGEFAKFLRADTAEREPLLTKIFATDVYKQVSEILNEKAKVARSEFKDATTAIIQSLAQFQLPVGYTVEQREAISSKIKASIDDEVLAEISEAAASVKTEAELAQQKTDKALADWQAAKAEVVARQAELDAQMAVARATGTLENKHNSLETSLQELKLHAATLATAGVEVADDYIAEQWRAASAALSTLIGQINEAKASEVRLGGHPARRAKLEAEIEEQERAIADLTARLAELPTIVEALRISSDSTAATTRVEVIDNELERMAEQLEAHAELLEVQLEVAAAAERVTKAQQTAVSKQKVRDELVSRRIAGMAGELAAALQPGDACQVCGSTEHPRLATQDDSAVTADDVAAADAEVSSALTALESARSASEAFVGTIAGLKARATSDRATIEAAQKSLAVEKSDLLNTVASARADAVKLQDALNEQDEANQKNVDAASAMATLQSALISENEQAENDRVTAETARGEFDSVAERITALSAATTAIDKCASCRAEVDAAATALAEATKTLDALPHHEAFAYVDSADERATLAEASYLEHKTVSDSARERSDLAGRLAGDIRDGIQSRREVLAGSADLIKLADVFNKDAAGQGINIYVLQALFSDVLESANSRFSSLLEGRYRLVVSDESDGRKNAVRGLGLNVLDTRSGEERSAKTLSGGESFCASLSLALGMADIVRAHAGGISIETLFIDEGFGSLDGTRLNDVMNMLQGLQRSGRSVGVISHVDEMKGQIQERINVIPGGKDKPTKLEVTWMQ